MKNFDRKACDKWDKREPKVPTGKHFSWRNDPKDNAWRLNTKKRDEAIKRAAIQKSKDARHHRGLLKEEELIQVEREQAGVEFGDWS